MDVVPCKRYFLSCVFVLSFSGFANAQLDGIAGGLLVGKALDDFGGRLENLASKAAADADYLLEKNARLAQAIIRDTRIQFEDVLDKRIDSLKIEHQKFLNTIDRLIGEISDAKGRLLELQDFLALDLENISQQLPGAKGLFGNKLEKLSFRRLDGFSQTYQEDGVYTFRFIGAAFGLGYGANVMIDGKPVKLLDMRTPRNYVLECDIPVSQLNTKFKDKETVRVDVKAQSFKGDNDKPVFVYDNKILLLPKTPLQFSLTEHYLSPGWSEEKFWTEEASTIIKHVGPGGKTYGKVSVSIPSGCKMAPDSVAYRCEPGLGLNEAPHGEWVDDQQITNEGLTISRGFRTYSDKVRTVFCKVQYQKPVQVRQDRVIKVDGKDHIGFGTTFVDLSKTYQSFTIQAKWFNGKSLTLSPTHTNELGVNVSPEILTDFKRLAIQIKWPEGK